MSELDLSDLTSVLHLATQMEQPDGPGVGQGGKGFVGRCFTVIAAVAVNVDVPLGGR